MPVCCLGLDAACACVLSRGASTARKTLAHKTCCLWRAAFAPRILCHPAVTVALFVCTMRSHHDSPLPRARAPHSDACPRTKGGEAGASAATAGHGCRALGAQVHSSVACS